MKNKLLWLPIPPSKTCVHCGKEFSEIGGFKIVAQDERGLSFTDFFEKGTPKTEIIRHHGEKSFLTKEMIENSMEMCKKNQRPVYCVVCGKHLCELCGQPLALPDNFHYVNESGELFEAPLLESNNYCTNLNCDNCNEYKK
jgi:hypothetical protein